MVDKKRSSWPSSSVVISVVVVLLCLGEFIRVELILKQHVTRIQDLESNCVQNNRPQHDGGTTKKTPSVDTLKQDPPRVRVRRNASTQRDIDRLQCTVTVIDKKCRAGPPGPIGMSGRKGERGEKGVSGPKGEIGMRGLQGMKGIMGLTGIKGERGHAGPPGMPGLKGESGMPGMKGEPGMPGWKGELGMPGWKGETGMPGWKGDPGMPGMKGDPGVPGMKGDPGVPGIKGESGMPGWKGEPGMQGWKGEPGMPGWKGEPGMPGWKGDPGMPGMKGDPGVPGIKGDPGLSASYPAVIVSPPSLAVKEGDKAVFHCSSSGYPKPVIGWWKVDETSKFTSDHNLVISNATRSDSGMYQCEATNLLGSARRTVHLTVQFRPRVSMKSVPVFAKEGDNVTLPRCRVTGSPIPTITWSRASGKLDTTRTIINKGRFSIINLQQEDSDIYFCSSENILGSSRKNVQLFVIVLPKFVTKPPDNVTKLEGETFSLNCNTKGDLKPVISWRKENGNLPSGGRSEVREGALTIKRAQKGDSGVYVCSATTIGMFKQQIKTRLEVKTRVAIDCSELYKSGERRNGVYTVDPDGRGPFRVYCDMTTDGGGWTVFQRRQDGSVDFYRGWNQYKKGFGTLTGEFWLGNDKIHRLTSRTATTLRVNLNDWKGRRVYAKYDSFSVGSEGSNYTLNVSLYSGSAGDSLFNTHDGRPFTTKDRDNDLDLNGNCARLFAGAWWYASCHISNLNGKYLGNVIDGKGIAWYGFSINSLKFAEMMLKALEF